MQLEKARSKPGKVDEETRSEPGRKYKGTRLKPGKRRKETRLRPGAPENGTVIAARASTFFKGQRIITVTKYLKVADDGLKTNPLLRFLRPVADLTQATDQATGSVNFALPDDHHPPPDFPELSPHDPVSFHIPLKLPAPEFDPCFWHVTKAAALVSVPETAVNQNNRPVTR